MYSKDNLLYLYYCYEFLKKYSILKKSGAERNCYIDMNRIEVLCRNATIEVTQHILMRCQQRHITYGEIKEEYPEQWDSNFRTRKE